jgi:asparagine synthase (glutamine-hydrolysing)
MACGLEVRVPLLDHKMVELVFKIDCDLLYHNNMRKYILKKALAKWVPSRILTVRKKGFSIPIKQWMKSYLQGWSLKALNDGSLVNQGILKPNLVQDIMACGDSRVLWLLFAAELWSRRWIEGCSMREIKKLNSISL